MRSKINIFLTKTPLEQCDEEENEEVTAIATVSCLKRLAQ